MAGVIQSRYGRPRPAPPRLVLVRVHLPALAPSSTDEQEHELEDRATALKQALEECASKWLIDNLGEAYANSDYRIEAEIVR